MSLSNLTSVSSTPLVLSSSSSPYAGWMSGLFGVIIFAGSLPATRVAVADFDPIFLTCIRATIAAVLAWGLLTLLKQPRPSATQLPALGLSALGVVVGFPLFTGIALQYVSSAHCIVFVGLLPLCTALFAVLRGGERPRPLFWLFSLLGAVFVGGYAALGQTEISLVGDGLMLAAILACGMGYAEGAKLSKVLGGWQVISWSLLISLPIMLPIALFTWPEDLHGISVSAWVGLAYVSIFSMLIGFVFWYRGLALGGIATVGQLQLIQPFIGLVFAALLLGEQVNLAMVGVTLIAVLCVAGAKRFA